MHELSIAQAIVAVVERHAQGRRVCRVHVRAGRMRQVVPSALQFSFELLTNATALDGAQLEIEEVPVRGVCRRCSCQAQLTQFPLQCPDCGDFDVEIVAGEELLVDELECEEELATEGTADGGARAGFRR